MIRDAGIGVLRNLVYSSALNPPWMHVSRSFQVHSTKIMHITYKVGYSDVREFHIIVQHEVRSELLQASASGMGRRVHELWCLKATV